MRIIPIEATPAQTFYVVLDNQYCTISLYWRQVRLYADMLVGSTVICQGVVCQNRANILPVPSRGFNGSIHFFDAEGDRPPGYEQLDYRYFLIFVPAGEGLPELLRY